VSQCDTCQSCIVNHTADERPLAHESQARTSSCATCHPLDESDDGRQPAPINRSCLSRHSLTTTNCSVQYIINGTMLYKGHIHCEKIGTISSSSYYYVPVRRKSVHIPIKGFGQERDGTGFFHFVDDNHITADTIFLQVRSIVDYSCSDWFKQKTNDTHSYKQLIKRVQPNQKKFGKVLSLGSFTKMFELTCNHRQYCMPSECHTRSFFDKSTLNNPSYWKHDPPLRLHSINADAAIVYWAGHDHNIYNESTCGKRVIVDYRRYKVTSSSYFFPNGTLHPIACQQNHNYFRMVKNVMIRCKCNMYNLFLNCA
jgi:hypothetical protein